MADIVLSSAREDRGQAELVADAVLSKKSIEPSRSSMIVTEESPKSLAATDGAVSTRWCEALWRNQPIVKTLVIPFRVIIRLECPPVNSVTQVVGLAGSSCR
jgi:hypothetical protein